MNERVAVVLFNLGGPDRLEAVGPFLINLFNDPAIIRRRQPLRWLLARLIAWRRRGAATAIYRRLGGGSPLLQQTEAQAAALQRELADPAIRVFVSMRYWHPRAAETVGAVKRFDPGRIVLLPLYPQFSSTTTASSFREWRREAGGILDVPTARVCCYPDDAGFVAAQAARIGEILDRWEGPEPRILYSAHGVPKAFIEAGDPYRAQVERSVAAIAEAVGRQDLDRVICYQSRVGPLEWIGPYTDREIERAGAEGRPVVVVPVAFVSEHSETLVELDEEYRALARASGVPRYERAATVGTHPAFVAGLAGLVRRAMGCGEKTLPGSGGRICGPHAGDCPVALAGAP
ncbi:MAG: ferrochelatase [Defluviicoccus sp.]|nr:ferrochelatase [Defluviicoccus sp.]